MKIFCIYRVGAVEGAHPIMVKTTMDAARRFIKQSAEQCFIVERQVRLEYGMSPETISKEYRVRCAHGVNYYEQVKPFKIHQS